MAEPAKRNATYADLLALPEGVKGEIIFGALHAHPSPAPPHGSSQFPLSVELGDPFQKSRGGHLSYLHPVERYLEVSALRDGSWVHIDTFDDAEEFRAPPFDAVAFRLADLWPIPPVPDQA